MRPAGPDRHSEDLFDGVRIEGVERQFAFGQWDGLWSRSMTVSLGAVEGREVLGAESVDEGLADAGNAGQGGRLDGSQPIRCQHDVHTAAFRQSSRLLVSSRRCIQLT